MKHLLNYSLDFIKNEKFKYKTTKDVPERFKQTITRDLPKQIERLLEIDETIQFDYKIKGSIGEGNLAEIPYVVILDKSITTSAKKGIYIVLLFSKDGSSVYLSLNQGWLGIKDEVSSLTTKPRESAKTRASLYLSYLRKSIDLDYSKSNIQMNLRGKGHLGKGYEYCNIYSVEIKSHGIDTFQDELRNFIRLYSIIKKFYLSSQNQNEIISNSIINLQKGIRQRYASAPKQKKYKDKKEAALNPHVEEKAEKGSVAESYVLKKLREKLHEPFKIEDVSKINAGYDIRVTNSVTHLFKGLEVKNITSIKTCHFYLTQFEMHKLDLDESRVVLFDDGNIYISKKICDCSHIKTVISFYKDNMSLDEKKWISQPFSMQSESTKISITSSKFYDDFIHLDDSSSEQLIKFLVL